MASIRYAVVHWHREERLVEWCLITESQSRLGRDRTRFRLNVVQTSGSITLPSDKTFAHPSDVALVISKQLQVEFSAVAVAEVLDE